MGEIEVKGRQSLDLLQLVLTRNLADQTGQIKLSALLNEEGGIIDDLTVYKMASRFIYAGNQRHNQGTRLAMDKMICGQTIGLHIGRCQRQTGKLDLQGPAQEILQTLTNYDLKNLRFYHFAELVLGFPAIISRSGYTGEDGFEIYAGRSHR